MESRIAPDAAQQQSPSAAQLLAVCAWCCLFFLSVLAIFALKAPDAKLANTPQNEFSAERAAAHVRKLAQVPHPTGTNSNAEAREYLFNQLSALGMNPQIFTAVGNYNGSEAVIVGRIHDIVGRLSGTSSSRAILLMAHYDSVSSGPGASDDSSGVAAILEGVRALKLGPRLKNDLIVLMTDGEEPGLIGAEAFAASHPWMKDVGLVMNFEARGSQGPSLIFETSDNNATLMSEVARSASHPIGSSLFYSLYKLLPNDTDFSAFRSARIAGLNFAFGGRLEAYHSSLDTPENLDLRSLQHQGSYLLSVARHFGQMDLGNLSSKSGDSIFFNLLGANLITYSERWVLPGEIAVTVLLMLVIISGVQRAGTSPGHFFRAIAVSLLILFVIPGTMAITAWLLFLVLRGRMLLGDTPANSFLLIGLALLGAVSGSVVLAHIRRRFQTKELWIAGMTIVCILSWSLALLLPAGNYLLFWPLLVAVCGCLIAAFFKAESPQSQAWAAFPSVTVTVLLFAPLTYLLYVFLTLNTLSVVAGGFFIGLFFIICAPFVNIAVPQRPWHTIVLPLLVMAITAMASGIFLSRFSSQHPHRDNLLYSLNADDHTAVWISNDSGLDEYTGQFLGKIRNRGPIPNYLTGSQRPHFSASAVPINLFPPIAEIRTYEQQGTLHHLRMTVKSQRQATLIALRFGPNVKPVSAEISGRKVKLHPDRAGPLILLYAMGPEGSDLDLLLDASSGVSFWISDYSAGLPTTIRRSPEFIAAQGSDQTVVCRKYQLQ